MALISVVMMNRMIARHPGLEERVGVPPQASEAQDPPDRLARLDHVARVMECGRRLRDVLPSLSNALEAPERAEYELAVVQFLGRLYWTILVPLCAGRPPVEAVQFIGREMSAEDLLWLK